MTRICTSNCSARVGHRFCWQLSLPSAYEVAFVTNGSGRVRGCIGAAVLVIVVCSSISACSFAVSPGCGRGSLPRHVVSDELATLFAPEGEIHSSAPIKLICDSDSYFWTLSVAVDETADQLQAYFESRGSVLEPTPFRSSDVELLWPGAGANPLAFHVFLRDHDVRMDSCPEPQLGRPSGFCPVA